MTFNNHTALLGFFAALVLSSGCALDMRPTASDIPSTPATESFPADRPPITPTAIFPATPTVLPTLTSRAVPTLPTEEAYARVRAFLQRGPICDLPCWWGITPGISTTTDVDTQLTMISSIAEHMHRGNVTEPWFTVNVQLVENDTLIEVSSAYLPSAEGEIVVTNVKTQALPSNQIGRIYGDEKYNQLLSAYSLSQILASLGIPTQIFFTAEIYHIYEQNAPDFFEIRLMYPDKGVFATYVMPAETHTDTYKLCPDNSSIELTLMRQGLGEGYQELLLKLGDEWSGFFPPAPHHKTSEEAIGMTIEEFHQLFSSSMDHCLESPISIWPER